jgi:glycine/D-amino acid oxidase-like deaminating enzyme
MDHPIVICGAGIAGIATAYYLLKKDPGRKVCLIDKNQPMSFTTSKSGENFRDYWPQSFMQDFVSDSIQLMEALRQEYGAESFDMRYTGYQFISQNKEEEIFGTVDQGNTRDPFEELNDAAVIHLRYPYLSKQTQKVVTIKNAGSLDVFALGSLMLREAKKMGMVFWEGEIVAIEKKGSNFQVQLDNNHTLAADKIVIATGPFINHLAAMLGFQFPIENTLQRKFIIPDPAQLIPRNMPFTIYADAQYLDWDAEEKAHFAKDEKYRWLLEKFPGGLHLKPEGSGIKFGWAFSTQVEKPDWHIASDDLFPQIVLKGASRFIPALKEYYNNMPSPVISFAGYYTRTKENWPLIGPTELNNVFVVGALAGYGTMSACAAGLLCANYVINETSLPDYARYFHPLRYADQDMLILIKEMEKDGQL